MTANKSSNTDPPPKMQIGNSIGQITPDEWFTRSQAARKVGRHVDTIKRWQESGDCVPSGTMKLGKLEVWLYSKSDISKMIKFATHQKPGRKPTKLK